MPSSHHPDRNGNGASDASALLNFLHEKGKTHTLTANQVLFREGDICLGAYFIQEGSLELTISSGERGMHLGWGHPGHLLGISAVLGNCEMQCTATAILSSTVIFVSAQEIRDYLQGHAEICLLTAQLLATEIVDLSTNRIRPLRVQGRHGRGN